MMMTLIAVGIFVAVGILIAILVVLLTARRKEADELRALEQRVTERVTSLQHSLDSRVASLDERLTRSIEGVHQTVSSSLGSSNEALRQTSERLATIDAAAKRLLEEVGPAVTDLQQLLRAPGMRGGYGEFLLEQLLAESLPSEHFSTQYAFRDGDRVDAIVRLPEGILPIDSKFPLDAFQRLLSASSEAESRQEERAFTRSVRNHIEGVARYIRPHEGTLPFALMYIPSESVYYEVVVRDRNGIITEARSRHVFIVSPNTMYCYLQAIGVGLRGMRIEQRAREIAGQLDGLRNEFGQLQENLRVLGNHLTNAKNKHEEVARVADRFQGRLDLTALPDENGSPPELPL
jgi:DNA recombination protein RmuC